MKVLVGNSVSRQQVEVNESVTQHHRQNTRKPRGGRVLWILSDIWSL